MSGIPYTKAPLTEATTRDGFLGLFFKLGQLKNENELWIYNMIYIISNEFLNIFIKLVQPS